MKILILKDKKIDNEQLQEVERQFIDLMYENALITPVFSQEDYNFDSYPKEVSSDGDEHLPDSYLRKMIADVYKKHGETIDHIIPLIHRDNWNLNGIWGTNYSNIYNGYQVHLCRFDNRNLANSLGTIYHECMHSFDAFIKTYTGVDINKLGKFGNWDKHVVHGGRPDQVGVYKWGYIRHKENTDILAYISVSLREAYKKRSKLNTQKTLINVLERLVVAYRALINKKSTVKK